MPIKKSLFSLMRLVLQVVRLVIRRRQVLRGSVRPANQTVGLAKKEWDALSAMMGIIRMRVITAGSALKGVGPAKAILNA